MLGPLWNQWLSHHGLLFRFDSKHLPLIKHIILFCYQGNSPTMCTLIIVEGLLLFCPLCCLSPGEMPPLCYACLFQLTPSSLLCRLSFPHTLHSVSKALLPTLLCLQSLFEKQLQVAPRLRHFSSLSLRDFPLSPNSSPLPSPPSSFIFFTWVSCLLRRDEVDLLPPFPCPGCPERDENSLLFCTAQSSHLGCSRGHMV